MTWRSRMPRWRDAQRLGRLDIFLAPDRQRLPAHDARHVEPQHRPDGEEHQHEIAPEEHHQHDDEEDEGQRIEHVDDAHHDLVGLAADKARGRAVEHADHHRHDAGKQADGQRDAACDQRSRQQVAPGVVGAEQEILLLDRGAHDHLQAVGGLALDLGVVECIRAVEIADIALVDLLGGGDGHENALTFLMPFLHIDAHALDRVSQCRLDHVGLRIGRETGRGANIVGIDRGVDMRHEIGADDADDRRQRPDRTG